MVVKRWTLPIFKNGPSNDNCDDIFQESNVKVDIGSFVVIRINPMNLARQVDMFVAICQSQVVDDELEVMYMKSETDNITFPADDNDVSYVNIEQVVKMLPNLKMIVRKNSFFFTNFKQNHLLVAD